MRRCHKKDFLRVPQIDANSSHAPNAPLSAIKMASDTERIQTLRARLGDLLTREEYTKTDLFIDRFLRAKDGNLEAAEKALRATIAWRKEVRAGELRSLPLNPDLSSSFPVLFEGRDRAGRPLVTCPVGRWDLTKASGDETRFALFKLYCIQIYEKIMAEIEVAERERLNSGSKRGETAPVTQYTVIYNYEGFSYRPILSVTVDKHMTSIAGMVDANYPETVANIIYINCPSVINAVMSLLKPLMSSKTFGRIRTFSADRAAWQKEILELVDPDQLPPEYGGTKGN